MERQSFTNNATGRLVEIKTHKKDCAFIPQEFPITWSFDPKLWPLLVDAKEALGTLNGIGQTLPDYHLLLQPLQNQEAIKSSKIEGTYVTPEQLLLFKLDPREPKAANDRRSDWMEVFNYGKALETGIEMLNTLPICNRIIRKMHEILMGGVRGQNKNPGGFRQWQVQIGASGRFIPPPASEVDRLMNNLEIYINSKNHGYDPLVLAFIIHYQFEAIHPFGDGNGRVGRALLALMIYQWLGHKTAWLYMSPFFERYRDEYVDCLFKISANGEYSKWIEFCLNGTITQAKDSICRCHKLNSLRTEFPERFQNHTARTHAIIDGLFASPVITIPEISKKFHIAHQTAKSDIKRLIDAHILTVLENTHPQTFFSPEIMEIAYGEPENLEKATTDELPTIREEKASEELSNYTYSEVALPPSLNQS
ncbi:MAG: Fic family protein [Thermoguttaceae bacterium]